MSSKQKAQNKTPKSEKPQAKVQNEQSQVEQNPLPVELGRVNFSDGLPDHPTTRSLRQAQILQMQRTHGTLYLAPEVILDWGLASPASDIFSLCALIGWWVTGEHPFAGDTLAANRLAILTGDRRPLGGPDHLGRLLDRGLALKPDDRPGLDEIADHLTDLHDTQRPRMSEPRVS